MEFLDLRRDIDRGIEAALSASSSSQLLPAQQRAVISAVIDHWITTIRGAPRLPRQPRDFRSRFSSRYGPFIQKAKAGVFQKLPLTQGQSRQLTTIGHLMFERVWLWDLHSGIVVAGYGRGDLFPITSESVSRASR